MYHLNDNLQMEWKKLKFTKDFVLFSHYLDVVKYPQM